MPFHQLNFGDSFSDIGHLDHVFRHLNALHQQRERLAARSRSLLSRLRRVQNPPLFPGITAAMTVLRSPRAAWHWLPAAGLENMTIHEHEDKACLIPSHARWVPHDG